MTTGCFIRNQIFVVSNREQIAFNSHLLSKTKVRMETALNCTLDDNDMRYCVIHKPCGTVQPAEIYCEGAKYRSRFYVCFGMKIWNIETRVSCKWVNMPVWVQVMCWRQQAMLPAGLPQCCPSFWEESFCSCWYLLPSALARSTGKKCRVSIGFYPEATCASRT